MPLFASFVLLDSPEGCEMLRRYADSYFDLAQGRQWGLCDGHRVDLHHHHPGEAIGMVNPGTRS
ncbi:hypothetical protein M1D34_31155 (plasmid) [Ensifer sp. D2-11]